MERTLVVIKPDGVEKNLVGEVTKRLENAGLKLVQMKTMQATPEFVEAHYTLDPDWRRVTGEKTIMGYQKKGLNPPSNDPYEITASVLEKLKKYITRCPVIPMVWEGENAVQTVRKVAGGTEPASAEKGTIRGDYATDSYELADGENRSVENILHASGSIKEAQMEIHHWFPETS